MVDTEAISNLEGNTAFDVDWQRSRGKVTPGFTAVLRVKDEARNMPYVLPSLFRAVASVIVIDNGSTDGTPDIVRDVAEQVGMSARLTVMDYPFVVSRCGSEHLHTPPESVHSLTYFYNWSFSHVETRYALKWDGDMVLTHEGEQIMRDLAWQLEAADVVLPMPRVAVYVESRDVAFVDIRKLHAEPFAWPNTAEYTFTKGFEWEVPLRPDDVPVRDLPSYICFELKWLDSDEFTNWTGQDFISSGRSGRKQRDWRLFTALNAGETPNELVRLERGSADHVVDVVRAGRRAWWEQLAADAATSR